MALQLAEDNIHNPSSVPGQRLRLLVEVDGKTIGEVEFIVDTESDSYEEWAKNCFREICQAPYSWEKQGTGQVLRVHEANVATFVAKKRCISPLYDAEGRLVGMCGQPMVDFDISQNGPVCAIHQKRTGFWARLLRRSR